MIVSFRHKGLETFFRSGTQAGIQPIHAKRLHGLSGDRAGFHAMTVQANWRLVFRFDETNVALLDYIDYH